jgi:ParB/RepB/Spo0J family partition protein
MNELLKRIPLSNLMPHPDNPRLIFRDDVVDGITAQLRESGVFPDMHALIVRPWQDNYQILSGHQRREAARRAGIAEVPCWVVEVDDAAALMMLVTSNNQGELSPLEIGLHVLKAVPTAQGKKGKGLEAYAKAIGKTKQYVSQLRQAAEVVTASNPSSQLDKLGDKAQHLCAIHALPKPLWPRMVEGMVQGGWSVAETEAAVNRLRDRATRRSSETPKVHRLAGRYVCMEDGCHASWADAQHWHCTRCGFHPEPSEGSCPRCSLKCPVDPPWLLESRPLPTVATRLEEIKRRLAASKNPPEWAAQDMKWLLDLIPMLMEENARLQDLWR